MKKVLAAAVFGLVTIPVFAQTSSDCVGAITICDSVYVSAAIGDEVNTVPGEINPMFSCLGTGEERGTWYRFITADSGALSFTIIPADSSYDFDWALFDLSAHECSDIFGVPEIGISCDFSGVSGTDGTTGADTLTGQGHRPPVAVGQGTELYLYISTASLQTSQTLPYTIDFTGSEMLLSDCSVGLTTDDLKPPVSIFPNPAVSTCFVSAEGNFVPRLITVYTTGGQEIIRKEAVAGGTWIDGSAFPRGVYFFRISDASGQSLMRKVIFGG